MIKKVEWKPPMWSKELRKIYSWCLKHGIKIYPVAAAKGEKNKNCYIEVSVNGKTTLSPKHYGVNELWPKNLSYISFIMINVQTKYDKV